MKYLKSYKTFESSVIDVVIDTVELELITNNLTEDMVIRFLADVNCGKDIDYFKANFHIYHRQYLDTRKGCEYIFIFNNGRCVKCFVGNKKNVNFNTNGIYGAITHIHNHPNGSTFSLEDFKTCLSDNINKMVVVTDDNIYTLESTNGKRLLFNINLLHKELYNNESSAIDGRPATINQERGEIRRTYYQTIIDFFVATNNCKFTTTVHDYKYDLF